LKSAEYIYSAVACQALLGKTQSTITDADSLVNLGVRHEFFVNYLLQIKQVISHLCEIDLTNRPLSLNFLRDMRLEMLTSKFTASNDPYKAFTINAIMRLV
jgi:hypothetical protein